MQGRSNGGYRGASQATTPSGNMPQGISLSSDDIQVFYALKVSIDKLNEKLDKPFPVNFYMGGADGFDANKPQRSAQMVFGLWHGMQFSPKNYFNNRFIAPLISHSNYLPDGTKNGELSLTSEYILKKYHFRYREWVEKNKKVIKGRARLTPRDINQLDLRNKVHLHCRDFLIHKLSIPVMINTILPAEVEFVEA